MTICQIPATDSHPGHLFHRHVCGLDYPHNDRRHRCDCGEEFGPVMAVPELPDVSAFKVDLPPEVRARFLQAGEDIRRAWATGRVTEVHPATLPGLPYRLVVDERMPPDVVALVAPPATADGKPSVRTFRVAPDLPPNEQAYVDGLRRETFGVCTACENGTHARDLSPDQDAYVDGVRRDVAGLSSWARYLRGEWRLTVFAVFVAGVAVGTLLGWWLS